MLVPLVTNSCLSNKGVPSTIIKVSDSSLKFSFSVFRWRTNPTDMVYIFCFVKICKKMDPNCQPNCGNAGRKRRSVGKDTRTTQLLASIRVAGPLPSSNLSLPGDHGNCLNPNLLALLIFITFIFFSSIIVVILHLTRSQSMEEYAKHVTSRYFGGVRIQYLSEVAQNDRAQVGDSNPPNTAPDAPGTTTPPANPPRRHRKPFSTFLGSESSATRL
uniref:ZP domain-containing protein n=1 Tax=Ciona savignyi TaxID=51511 RepID=H2Y7V8_CIOSA